VIRTDVTVVGDGPAGAATALALLARGVGVALVGHSPAVRIGEHLPPRAWASLETLGARDLVARGPHRSCPGVASRWGGDAEEGRDYLFQPWLAGANLDRAAFDRDLANEVGRQRGRVFADRPARALAPAGGGWRLTLAGDVVVESAFIVDATGRRAWVGRRAGARIAAVDRLVALWARFRPDPAPCDARLRVGAVSRGWCYAAPLADDTVAAAYLTDADLVPTPRDRAAAWTVQLRSGVALGVAPGTLLGGGLRVVAARSQWLEPAAGRRWIAVGDAAMAFDPLSSAGIAKALADGVLAADTVTRALTGDVSAPDEWSAAVQHRLEIFLADRRHYYGLERRWPDSPFWRRRLGTPDPAEPAVPRRRRSRSFALPLG
jgi:flavin-dependent dehydrogenase